MGPKVSSITDSAKRAVSNSTRLNPVLPVLFFIAFSAVRRAFRAILLEFRQAQEQIRCQGTISLTRRGVHEEGQTFKQENRMWNFIRIGMNLIGQKQIWMENRMVAREKGGKRIAAIEGRVSFLESSYSLKGEDLPFFAVGRL
jgi:hypothetical protein